LDFAKENRIALLLLEIYKGFINRKPIGVLFLDIKGVYDNVNPSILIDIINDMRIPVQSKKFISNLLSYRNVKFYDSGRFIGSRSLFEGLPQGFSLSPLLFNLYIKDILNFIPYDKTVQFANDIVVICSYRTSIE